MALEKKKKNSMNDKWFKSNPSSRTWQIPGIDVTQQLTSNPD